ncbi:MAG: Electron transfer flavoprotein, alpha subunit, partial [uncultured Nocardioidaceae bacterium]
DPRARREGPRRRRGRGLAGDADLRPLALGGRRRGARRRGRRGRRPRPPAGPARGVRRPRRAPPHRWCLRRLLGSGLGVGHRDGPRRHPVGRGDGRRHLARQRGARARGGPGGRPDGRQRALLRWARAVRGHPPGRRRPGAGGDAAGPAAHGLHRRRARGGGGPGGEPRHRHRRRARTRGGRGRPGGPRRVVGAARPGPVREPEVGPGRRRRRSRRRQRRGVRGAGRAGRAARRLDRRLARGHLPGLAPAPRAGRPDRQPHLAGPLHPVRHQRSHPALGRLQQREEHPGHQHRPRRPDGHQGDVRRDRRPPRGRARRQCRDQAPAGSL